MFNTTTTMTKVISEHPPYSTEGIESIPKHKHARVDEPMAMELKPLRFPTKRQKMMDKINSSGSEAKIG